MFRQKIKYRQRLFGISAIPISTVEYIRPLISSKVQINFDRNSDRNSDEINFGGNPSKYITYNLKLSSKESLNGILPTGANLSSTSQLSQRE
jgi:hypothetical protein